MLTLAEVHYFAEEMELYSPEGNFIGNADFRLTIDVIYDQPWQVADIEYPNGANVQHGQYGYALFEIAKLSLMRPENKRHVRNIEDMVADARHDARRSARLNASELQWRFRREGV